MINNKAISELEIIKDINIIQDINDWIDRIDQTRTQLQGLKICPYAKSFQPEVIIAKLPYPELFYIVEDFTMIIFIAPEEVSHSSLIEYVVSMSEANPSLIFLADHRSEPTFMSGQQTNNGNHNAVVCQPNHKLGSARDKLAKTVYYELWQKNEWEHLLRVRGGNFNDSD